MPSKNVLVIGGSRHIGYMCAMRFLNVGVTVHFLLRNPAVFDNDQDIQRHVAAGKAHLHQGDALVLEDVHNVWDKATKEQPVNLLLSTVGFTGVHKFHPLKGFIIDPKNIITQCLLNLLCTMPKTAPLPKVVIISTAGVTRSARAKVPLPLKVGYGFFFRQPVQDKLGAERLISHCAGWTWNPKDEEPSDEIMGAGWMRREGLPAPGTLKDALVVRAALLNDGECRGESSTGYRTAEGELGGWSISRQDVAHFIFEAVTKNWQAYGNKAINIAY